MATILEKWQISAEELTKIVDENPSLRGFMFGYVSEYKARTYFDGHENIEKLMKYDDHDRSSKGDISFIYKRKEFKIEAKSRQIVENYIKIRVGVAENAAPTLFLCLKKIKMPVYFCSFYAAARNE